MKRQIAVILITLSLGTFSWAQGSNDLFDLKKSQEELEIMKGILSSTISFVTQDQNQRGISIRRDPQAFYLADQGAVFVIPISSFPSYNWEISRALDATRESLNELRYNLDYKTLDDGSMLVAAPPAPPAPPALPAPPAPPAPPVTLAIPAPPSPSEPPEEPLTSQEYRKVMEKELQEARVYIEKGREEALKKREELRMLYQPRAEKSREEELKRREKLLQSLADIKVQLVEALANYGDSLTTVKSGEHINLVLTTQGFESRQNERFHTISAQKSWITDYKAGRLSLEDFKQKVRQYTQ